MIITLKNYKRPGAENLSYNLEKVRRGEAVILSEYRLRLQGGQGDLLPLESILEQMDRFLRLCQHGQQRPVVHLSLNPSEKDLTGSLELRMLCEALLLRLGLMDKPHITFLHRDRERQHAHILALRQDERGYQASRYLILRTARLMEDRYGICRVMPRLTEAVTPRLVPASLSEGHETRQVRGAVAAVHLLFRFSGLEEYTHLMRMLGVQVLHHEKKGKYPEHLGYRILDPDTQKTGKRLSAREAGKGATLRAVLQRAAETPSHGQDGSPRAALYGEVLRQAQASQDLEDLLSRLRQKGLRMHLWEGRLLLLGLDNGIVTEHTLKEEPRLAGQLERLYHPGSQTDPAPMEKALEEWHRKESSLGDWTRRLSLRCRRLSAQKSLASDLENAQADPKEKHSLRP